MRKYIYVYRHIIMTISHGYAFEITNNSVIIISSKPLVHNYTLYYYPYPVQ